MNKFSVVCASLVLFISGAALSVAYIGTMQQYGMNFVTEQARGK